MLENFRGWLVSRGGADSHADRQRRAQNFALAAKKAKKLDSPRDAAILATYVAGIGKDYDDVPAIFYYPPLGTTSDDIEKQIVALSLDPQNRGKNIYLHTGAELWIAQNGVLEKKQLVSDYA